eukprot:3856563-Prymnesium_polylepis.1
MDSDTRYFKPVVDGSKWRFEGVEPPTGYHPLPQCRGLVDALLTKTTFTQEEWVAFAIHDLRDNHYVVSRGRYFVPVVSGLKWAEEDHWPAGSQTITRPVADALLTKTTFTQEEWAAFGIHVLRDDHYVVGGRRYFLPVVDGLHWLELRTKPPDGCQLQPQGATHGLAAALLTKTTFTQEEWSAFGIRDLRFDHYVMSGTDGTTRYFVPDHPVVDGLKWCDVGDQPPARGQPLHETITSRLAKGLLRYALSGARYFLPTG